MINTIIALLVELELMKPEEGELLAQKIREATLPADYPSAARQLKEFLEDARNGK